MAIHANSSLLEQARNIFTTYKGTVGGGMTLADTAKVARVEPITLISSSLSGNKELYNILHGVLNVYTAYYLQAVNILSAHLVDTRILKILDKTNPDRDLKTFMTAGSMAFESQDTGNLPKVRTMSLENCQYRLPMLKSDFSHGYAKESYGTDVFGYDGKESEEYAMGGSLSRLNNFDKLGLTVGKIIDVQFSPDKTDGPGGTLVTIPVVVKLDTMIIPSEAINAIVASNSDEITLGSRFKDAISGRIGFIKDFLLASDLIKTQKRAMIKDPTGFYSQLLKRVNNSKIYSGLSGNVSLSGISAVYVLSEEDENEIQKKIGGRLSNPTTRRIVFDNTSAMMLVVIDKEWERVSIYIKDVDGFSQASFDSFKDATNKANNNIGDILKAFSLNNAPSF